MKTSQIIISVVLLTLLILINQFHVVGISGRFGGLSLVGWTSIALVLFGIGVAVAVSDAARTFRFLTRKSAKVLPPPVRVLKPEELGELKIKKYRGPDYPHPVIFPDRCIGCDACVEACPHDVLAIVDGKASVVARDQCMEDTSCQVVCPVNPKACIVINTAKEIRSQPAPTRNADTFMTNVPGCYIIGDVSGVPLIKNAVKEGAEVIEHITARLAAAPPEPKAEYDVAVIGIGPGGASAVLTAHDKGLRYLGIEQQQTLATITAYPEGKYIFFKPDSTDWQGGLSVIGLGLVKDKSDGSDGGANPAIDPFENALGGELERISNSQTALLRDELIREVPASIRGEILPLLEERTKKEIKTQFKAYLAEKAGAGGGSGTSAEIWRDLYNRHFATLPKTEQDAVLNVMRRGISDLLQHKIPGDQRERILSVWLGRFAERGVRINEYESCTSVKRADDGDYFIIKTERGSEKIPVTYRSRLVVLAIGLRGTPNKLRLDNEEKITINLNGKPEKKVLYSLSKPELYKGRNIIVVGGGNSAVEAAVGLVARRDGASIAARPPGERNNVMLLVRSFFATNVKFGNKLQLYQCLDEGLLDVKFGVAIKELREREAVIMNVQTKEVIETIPNDYVFALIGGERPDNFLKSIGISIVES
jgi:thioredoxin reductase/ferredoxin-like protein FixX